MTTGLPNMTQVPNGQERNGKNVRQHNKQLAASRDKRFDLKFLLKFTFMLRAWISTEKSASF